MTEIEPFLHPETADLLQTMYSAEALPGTESDSPVKILRNTRISVQQGAAIHALIRGMPAVRTLEIGFAYGYSTIWILDAHRVHPNAVHIAVDPFEKTGWDGIGLRAIEQLSYVPKTCFRWMENPSIHALTSLIRDGELFDLIYIDGAHLFDYIMVDMFLCDKLLKPEGLMILDDMWLGAVQRAVRFTEANRAYVREQNAESNIAVLRKLRDDDRAWDHYVDF